MLNTTILMGRLVADPELRHTPNNVAVTSFTLAVDRSYVKAGAERQVDFIDIVAWRSTAEFVDVYKRQALIPTIGPRPTAVRPSSRCPILPRARSPI